jgi:membrane protein
VFLYIYIPNTKVRFRSALLGGILAGTAWQVAQWAYFHFQVGVANYNAIYGTLAALPVFLVWVYTSWLIVLLGVEIVCAHQLRRFVGAYPGSDTWSQAAREERALALMLQVCRHFREGGAPPTAAHLARELALRQELVEEGVVALSGLGYLVQAAGSEPAWLPANDPSGMEVGQLLAALRGSAESGDASPGAMALAADIIRRDAENSRISLNSMTLRDLLDVEERGEARPPSPEGRG